MADDNQFMHSPLPGHHARRFNTRRAAGLHDCALQPVIGGTRQFGAVFFVRCIKLWNDLPGSFSSFVNLYRL